MKTYKKDLAWVLQAHNVAESALKETKSKRNQIEYELCAHLTAISIMREELEASNLKVAEIPRQYDLVKELKELLLLQIKTTIAWKILL